MSTETMADTAMSHGAHRDRDAMSFSNILNATATVTTDVTTGGPVLAPPTTPVQNAARVKEEEEELASPDALALDSLEAEEAADDSADVIGKDIADEDREFICMNDVQSRCQTGQYTLVLSRKVISDHFGRNKACTRDITDWPLFCRKHYQRATYNKKQWQIRKLDLIHRQFDVIEAQFPGTTYDIHFKKSEETRLNEYSRKVAAGVSEEDAKTAVVPVEGKHFEAPIDILRELYLETGKGKDIGEVKAITELILKMLQDESTDQVPSIEFLPNLPGKSATPKKTPKTPSPKKTPAIKMPSSKGTPSRVSAKGSVKKPSKKN